MARFEGKKIGQFFCVKRISSSASHDVYRAKYLGGKHPPFERLIEQGADVLLRITRHQDDSSLSRVMWFAKEMSLIAQLESHIWTPLIVRAQDAGYHYAVIPYERGLNLHHFMMALQREDIALRSPICFFIWHQIVEAVAECHQYISLDGIREPIVMEDLGPGRVFIAENGRVILSRLEAASHRIALEQPMSGHAPDMMTAPEQNQLESSTTATDVYRLGALGFWLFTHGLRCPDYMMSSRLIWPKDVQIHMKLKTIISHCVAHNPIERPLNALVVMEFLEAMSQDMDTWRQQLAEVIQYVRSGAS